MKIEATVASALVTSPWWVDLLQNINLVASAIAAVCGAIYGIYTVGRLIKMHREKKRLERMFYDDK